MHLNLHCTLINILTSKIILKLINTLKCMLWLWNLTIFSQSLTPVHWLTLWSANSLSNACVSAGLNFSSSSKNLVVLFTRYGSNQSACRLAYFLTFSTEFAICCIFNGFYPPALVRLVRNCGICNQFQKSNGKHPIPHDLSQLPWNE